MPHNFNNTLTLDAQGAPEAAGPVASGEEIIWIAVWIYQNIGGNSAGATGGAGWYGSPKSGTWDTTTSLVTGSAPFVTDKKARAMALALVTDGTETEFYWWAEKVRIVS